ncbi:MAG: hypothetical protein R2882_01535 [Gemmatimonadales bacterium]
MSFLIGAPLAAWLLTCGIRRSSPVFYVTFFLLTMYNGPLTATIFDVVLATDRYDGRGGVPLFIHIAGDSVAFPLVGMLSDRFGLDRAVYVLPIAALIGGVIVLGASRWLLRDVARAAEAPATGEFGAAGS